MADKEKRNRQANYTNEEKMTLLNVIEKYKDVILSKKTDHSTWKKKEIGWQNVSNEFNAVSPLGIHRSAAQLKGYFNNLKKKTRKDAADEKLSITKTGSGVPEATISDPTFEKTLSLLNTKTVYGLENRFDSDTTNNQKNRNSSIGTENLELNPIIEIEQTSSSSNFQDNNENNFSNNLPNTDSWTTLLQTKKKNKLSKGVTRNSSETIQKWSKRRRSTIPAQKSDLTVLYKNLAEEKLLYFKTQNAEMSLKRKRDSDEFESKLKWKEEKRDLKRKILLLELEVRQKQLDVLGGTFIGSFV